MCIDERRQFSYFKNKCHNKEMLVKILLGAKFLITSPFYVAGVINPDLVPDVNWILFMEAFHHFHARIFYLLALYRACTQLYFVFNNNKKYAFTFIKADSLFETGVICLYIHEHWKNGRQMFSSHFFLAQLFMSIVTLWTYREQKAVIGIHDHSV